MLDSRCSELQKCVALGPCREPILKATMFDELLKYLKCCRSKFPRKHFAVGQVLSFFAAHFRVAPSEGQLGTKDGTGGTKNCIQCHVEDARCIDVTDVNEDMEREVRDKRKSEGRGWCPCRCHRCQSRSRDSPRSLRNLRMRS